MKIVKVRKLDNVSFDVLLDCFLLAFENYYVKMPTNRDYYKQRWKAAKVDFSLSYGMFDEEHLVGFIIHAIDTRFGVRIAFNTGTGVIPKYRGRRIIKSIYDFAINDLICNGIKKSQLEVITKNEKALHIYQSVGFNICKDFMCFAGKIKTGSELRFELEEISFKAFDLAKLPNQEFYSWDFQNETIMDGNYNFYQVSNKKKPESYFAIHKDKKYLAQFEVLGKEGKGWSRLFQAIKQVSEEVKIINVDKRLSAKLKNIGLVDLKNTVNQYEMEMTIA